MKGYERGSKKGMKEEAKKGHVTCPFETRHQDILMPGSERLSIYRYCMYGIIYIQYQIGDRFNFFAPRRYCELTYWN